MIDPTSADAWSPVMERAIADEAWIAEKTRSQQVLPDDYTGCPNARPLPSEHRGTAYQE
jgi:hypothetical protein